MVSSHPPPNLLHHQQILIHNTLQPRPRERFPRRAVLPLMRPQLRISLRSKRATRLPRMFFNPLFQRQFRADHVRIPAKFAHFDSSRKIPYAGTSIAGHLLFPTLECQGEDFGASSVSGCFIISTVSSDTFPILTGDMRLCWSSGVFLACCSSIPTTVFRNILTLCTHRDPPRRLNRDRFPVVRPSLSQLE